VQCCSKISDREVTIGDFSVSMEHALHFIFLLTSIFIDSIHSISCNKTPLHDP
jgi:hypothetical protein